MNSIRITLISLFVASSAYAEEITKFVSLDACKVYYAKSVTPVAGETADTYCKDRIMTFVEACTATKISEYVTAQKLKAFTDLSDSEQRSKKTTFMYQCQVTAQNETAGNARNAANARSAAVAAAGGAAGVAAAAAASTQQKVANAQMLTQLAQQGVKISDNIEKATAKAAAANGGGQSAATSASQKAGDTAAVGAKDAKPTPTSDAKPAANASTDAQPTAATADAKPAATVSADPKPAATTGEGGTMTPEAATTAVKDGQAAAGQVKEAAADAEKILPPDKRDAVAELKETSEIKPDVAGKQTDITTSAKTTSGTLNSNIKTTYASALNALKIYPNQYDLTLDQMQIVQTDAQKYTDTAKMTCVSRAETASMLCVEGTSPGAIAAKQVMDAAGPVLSIISSAQKTCSSTAKVTRLVNLGLTVAKGVCVASKVACDSACASAVSNLTTIISSIQPKIGSAIMQDYEKNDLNCQKDAASQCSAATVGYAACYAGKYNPCAADNASRKTQAMNFAKELGVHLKNENVAATKGTSPNIVVSCQNHVKDIVLFGVQILGTYAAQQNAKACEEKLAASGASGATVSTQQYCEKSENVSTQICVCQKNPMATGCPGAVVADSSSSSNSADKGTNIKGVGGNSAFAGGFGSGPKANLGSGLGKDSINGALAGTSASGDGSGSGMDGFGGGGLAGAGGAGGLGGAPASSAEAAALKKEADEKKKWSFGSFGSEGGGGFSAGGAAGSKYKSGALTSGDQAAIQRQIASEKYAAEVSTASGKSNWEKIRNMYLIKENSFIGQ